MKNAWHALIDARQVNRKLCEDDGRILDVLVLAAKNSGAKILTTSRYHFGHDSPAGCATFVMLDESHISAHTYSLEGKAAIDIFTCSGKEACEKISKAIIAGLALENFALDFRERFV